MGGSPVIKHVHFVRKRLTGGQIRWYVYAWRGGPHVMWADQTRKPKLTEKAIEGIAAAKRERKVRRVSDPKILSSLIEAWQLSPEWSKLSANTKKTWGSALKKIGEKWGKVPLQVFDDTRMIERVINWRDSRASTPRAADIGIDVLRALLKFGRHRGQLQLNVAEGIGRLYVNGQRAEIVWTPEDLAAFSAGSGDRHQNVDDAVQLAALTGLRREDLACITWPDVREFSLLKMAKKKSRGRRRFANVPRVPQLDALLEQLRTRYRAAGVDTLLVTAAGHPWHLDTLTKEVTRIAKLAGIEHIDAESGARMNKHLHDVRGSFATLLMTTTDLTDEEIADIMGWSPNEVRRIRTIYVDDAARTVAIGRRIAGKL